MTDRDTMSGGCQCGAVRFAARVAPTEVYICHCRMCQKSVGGPFAGYAKLPAASFAWTRGQPAEWASSSLGLRQFCAGCGTPLGYRYIDEGAAAWQYLTTGSFDDFRTMVPVFQIGQESKLDWVDHVRDMRMEPLGSNLAEAEMIPRLVNHQHPDHDTPAQWLANKR